MRQTFPIPHTRAYDQPIPTTHKTPIAYQSVFRALCEWECGIHHHIIYIYTDWVSRSKNRNFHCLRNLIYIYKSMRMRMQSERVTKEKIPFCLHSKVSLNSPRVMNHMPSQIDKQAACPVNAYGWVCAFGCRERTPNIASENSTDTLTHYSTNTTTRPRRRLSFSLWNVFSLRRARVSGFLIAGYSFQFETCDAVLLCVFSAGRRRGLEMGGISLGMCFVILYVCVCVQFGRTQMSQMHRHTHNDYITLVLQYCTYADHECATSVERFSRGCYFISNTESHLESRPLACLDALGGQFER